MISLVVDVRDCNVSICESPGIHGLYYCREGIATRLSRETEIKVWNACDEIADAAMEIDKLVWSDGE